MPHTTHIIFVVLWLQVIHRRSSHRGCTQRDLLKLWNDIIPVILQVVVSTHRNGKNGASQGGDHTESFAEALELHFNHGFTEILQDALK